MPNQIHPQISCDNKPFLVEKQSIISLDIKSVHLNKISNPNNTPFTNKGYIFASIQALIEIKINEKANKSLIYFLHSTNRPYSVTVTRGNEFLVFLKHLKKNNCLR